MFPASLVSATLIAAMPWLATPALADTDQIEEIIVTARRVPELLRDVPLTIDVFDRSDMGLSGIESLQTLMARAPGLYFESTWGGLFSSPNLRGQQLFSTGDLNVGVFVDGVYQASPTAVDTGALDLERIEIARGPQSTLYGHSTFAGAIHYVSRAPSEIAESGITLERGSDDYRSASGYLSGPLVDGLLLGRLAAGAGAFDGTQENNAVPGSTLGGWDRAGAALTLATTGDRELQASLSLRFTQVSSTQLAASALTYTDYNCGGVESASGAWSYFCGDAPVRNSFDISDDLPDSENDVVQAALVISWPLANGRLESRTSFYRGNADVYRDFDVSSAGQSFGVCTFGENCADPLGIPQVVNRLASVNEVSRHKTQVREWGHEFRWQTNSNERLQRLLGAAVWWTDEDDQGLLGVDRGDLAIEERYAALLPTTPFIVGPVSLINLAVVDDPTMIQNTQSLTTNSRRTLALFGAIDYALTARVRTRAELRVTRERREVENQLANFMPGFGNSLGPQDFDDITPRFTVQYAPSESWSGYVAAAKGSKSGGINPLPGLLPQEQGFDPEYNWTYEISARYRDDKRGLSLQTTMYYIDWRNAQMLGFSDTPGILNLITRNTRGIDTRGLEFSLDARLAPTLRTELDLSFADPAFRAGSDDPGSRRFCGITATNTTSTFCTIGPSRSGSVTALVPYVDGNLPPRTPQKMWHAAMILEAPLQRGEQSLIFRLDANGQDDIFDRAIGGIKFGSRKLVDAQLSYGFGNWSVAVWGRNLTNQHYVRALASRGQVYFPTSPRPLDMIYGDSRRFGLSISYATRERQR
jgi:iron complex outermembrane receptor protein